MEPARLEPTPIKKKKYLKYKKKTHLNPPSRREPIGELQASENQVGQSNAVQMYHTSIFGNLIRLTLDELKPPRPQGPKKSKSVFGAWLKEVNGKGVYKYNVEICMEY